MANNNPEREMLRELEKIAKKVIRKALKDNTLDYTIQFTISSLEPEKVKYAALITSPSRGVQPITFVFESFNDLKAALEESVTGLDKKKIELTFHEDRINMYNNRIQAHQERIVMINAGEDEEDEDNIPMEEV